MHKISQYISYDEATKSQTAFRKGIKNTPDVNAYAAMINIGHKVFDIVRSHYGVPIAVTSMYRSPLLNKAIGGSPTSQHMKGEAIDMDADVYGGTSNKQIFDFIRRHLEFDQLIWEFGDEDNPAWVHVSLKRKGKQRMSSLRAFRRGKRTHYVKFDLY